MTSFIVVAVGSLVAGVLFNYLADVLPVMGDDVESEEPQPEFRMVANRFPSLYTLLAGRSVPQPVEAFAWRYPAVEILTVAFSLFVWGRLSDDPHRVIVLIYILIFFLIALIDLEHKLILTVVMIPAFVFAILEVLISTRITSDLAFIGYAVAQIAVMALYLFGQAYVWVVNRTREEKIDTVAFGFGDVTLATFCGLIIGVEGTISMLVLMVLIGGVSALLFLVIGSLVTGRSQMSVAIPYGPSIVLAAALVLLYGERVIVLLFGG